MSLDNVIFVTEIPIHGKMILYEDQALDPAWMEKK